jgi:hypothetical protein
MPSEKVHFMQKRCTLIPFGPFETLQINSCFMSTYHCVFGPKDERLEEPIVDKVQGKEGFWRLSPRRGKRFHNVSIKT